VPVSLSLETFLLHTFIISRGGTKTYFIYCSLVRLFRNFPLVFPRSALCSFPIYIFWHFCLTHWPNSISRCATHKTQRSGGWKIEENNGYEKKRKAGEKKRKINLAQLKYYGWRWWWWEKKRVGLVQSKLPKKKRGKNRENREKRQRQAGLNYEIHSLAKKSATARAQRGGLGKLWKSLPGCRFFY